MSLRFHPDDAAKLGWISKADAAVIKSKNRKSKTAVSTRGASANRVDPQKILFDALCVRLPGLPEWEKEGLIPGRKFRADIFIHPNTIIEFDGFRYHSSKTAYQKDRDRGNLFEAAGFRVFHSYAKMVFDEALLAGFVELVASTVESQTSNLTAAVAAGG